MCLFLLFGAMLARSFTPHTMGQARNDRLFVNVCEQRQESESESERDRETMRARARERERKREKMRELEREREREREMPRIPVTL